MQDAMSIEGVISEYQESQIAAAMADIRFSDAIRLPQAADTGEMQLHLDIARQLKQWMIFPRLWAQTDDLMPYAQSIADMQSCDEQAERLKQELLNNCKEDFFEQSAEKLLREYEGINGKWLMQRVGDEKKFFERLSVFWNDEPKKEEVEARIKTLVEY